MLEKKIASQKDHKIILKIWEDSVIETHDFLSSEDLNFYKKEIPNYLNLNKIEIILWFDNSKTVGFSGTNGRELDMLFLDPQFTNKGYGTQILEWLIENKKVNRVDVNEQNINAKNFYIKNGFKIMSTSQIDSHGKPYPILHLEKIK